MEKRCKECGKTLALESFHIARRSKFGVAGVCRGCTKMLWVEYSKRKAVYGYSGIKVCVTCSETKTHAEFHKKATGSFGLTNSCKKCVSIIYKSSHEKRLAKYEKERLQMLATLPRGEFESKWKQVLSDRREISAAASAKWRKNNPDDIKAQRVKARVARKSAEALEGGSFTASEWRALVNKFNKRCVCCGEIKPLTADHVVSVTKGGSSHISNIQPLCFSCNSAKGNRHSTDYRKTPFTGGGQLALLG
jgi:5-methylcytosine-specific restriction endonuclease McrA